MIGKIINNYEIKSLLGEGGMGAVYLARHPIIDRSVAIKVLKRELTEDRTLVGRFINEAKAAASIHHPNIIEVLDVGMLPDGVPYMMMELLSGESLGQRLHRKGRLSVSEALDVVGQAGSALVAAHACGIVHRDLKPENLFMASDPTRPGRERVKVLDFGIAKLRRELSGAAVRTGTGSLMGTPPYMSPEQCRGHADQIDQRTDVYAMGIILYEMLCGRPPFMSAGFGELMMMHMTEAPRPPRQLVPEIPKEIETVILHALAKTREARLPDMGALLMVLGVGQLLDTKPGLAQRGGESWNNPALSAPTTGMPVVGATVVLPPISDRSESALPFGSRRQGSTTFSTTTGQHDAVRDESENGSRAFPLKIVIGAAALVVGTVLALTFAGSRKPPTTATADPGATVVPARALEPSRPAVPIAPPPREDPVVTPAAAVEPKKPSAPAAEPAEKRSAFRRHGSRRSKDDPSAVAAPVISSSPPVSTSPAVPIHVPPPIVPVAPKPPEAAKPAPHKALLF